MFIFNPLTQIFQVENTRPRFLSFFSATFRRVRWFQTAVLRHPCSIRLVHPEIGVETWQGSLSQDTGRRVQESSEGRLPKPPEAPIYAQMPPVTYAAPAAPQLVAHEAWMGLLK